ncbi:hypothetical protein GCM10023115_12550 [Pontixanthobacter gangjinensis]
MLRLMIMLLGLVGLGLGLSQPAEARKVALIIGNSDYEFASPLTNPKNDVALIAASAAEANFDDVVVVENLGITEFETALRDFRKIADGAEVAMVYFAGHGIEGKGQNWLIPVDAKLNSDRDLPFEAIELSLITDTMAGAQVRMIVLDACRNSPFGQKWQSGTRAVNRGLASVEADDVIVIYAAAPGQTASDGHGVNSPFAQSLAKRLPEQDLPLQLLGGSVRDDVLVATDGDQRPFVSASVTGTPIYLVPRSAGGGQGAPIQYVVENVVITCVKQTETFGEDEIYLIINNGQRLPEENGSKYDIGKGEQWSLAQSFSSTAPISITIMEDDPIGDHDRIGIVETGTAVGSYTKTFTYDRGEYTVSYDVRLAS